VVPLQKVCKCHQAANATAKAIATTGFWLLDRVMCVRRLILASLLMTKIYSWQLALATGNWPLVTGHWQLATGNWQLATGDIGCWRVTAQGRLAG